MQQPENPGNSHTGKMEDKGKALSETISNAHTSGDGSLRLSEDGLVEPSGETIADAEANKEKERKEGEY